MSITPIKAAKVFRRNRHCGFTLVELLVVIAIIGILSSILLPALAKSKSKAQGIICLNNTRQLAVALILYADDHEGKLPYNLVMNGPASPNSNPADPTNLNWVNNYLDWEPGNSDNTNAAKMMESGLGQYVSKAAGVYRCPSDRVLDVRQSSAGWDARVRSYSMNAMVGDAGSVSQLGYNLNNKDYVQFFKYSAIPRPADIFVFLDEHPDSIDDGYFLNKANYPQWLDLPASYHDGAASFSFADGHSEPHRWHTDSTWVAARPYSFSRPLKLVRPQDRADFEWVISAMSFVSASDTYHY